jgi:hypothetical protein
MTSAPRRQTPAAAALSCLVSPLGTDGDECSRCGSSRRRLGGWPSSQASRSAKPRSCRLCSAHGHGPNKSSTISATSGGVRPPSCIRCTSPSHGSVVRLLIITTLLPPSRANGGRFCTIARAGQDFLARRNGPRFDKFSYAISANQAMRRHVATTFWEGLKRIRVCVPLAGAQARLNGRV